MALFQFEEQDEVYGRYEAILLLIAAVFVFVNALAFSLADAGGVYWQYLTAPTVWLLVMALAYWLLQRFKPGHDPFLLPIVGLMNGWGLLLIDRLAPNFLGRQLVWFGLSTAVLLAVAILPPSLRLLRDYRYTWLIVGLVLLAATLLFGVNPSGYGAELWLPLPLVGRVYFQPSELLKLLLIVFLASYFDEREPLLRQSKRPLPYLAPLLLMWGFCMLLLVWQRDLGAAALFFIVFLALLYMATSEKRYVAGGLLLLLLGGVFAYFAYDLVALRIDAWLDPWPDANNRSFQIVQALYALAAGGVLGAGIAQGFPTYIPVVHSDFAFAAIAEEWGLVGSLGVVILFALLAYRGMRLALLGQRPFHQYLAAGITILLSTQALLIMGGVTKLLPLTGVTLPFVSYGGSSLLLSGVMGGLLLYLSAVKESGHGEGGGGKEERQVMLIMLVGYLLVGLSLFYWGILRADVILAREDNPRLVEAELRIQRGQILDRDGVVLAQTVGDERVSRVYPLLSSGPAVGYYSFRHGTSGVEESFDAVLRGETASLTEQLARELLHQPQQGQAIQLTLVAEWQETADSLLPATPGALVLLELEDGVAKILALVSHPGYDPNLLAAQFDALTADTQAPLLNRVTQGQYQPGLLLQPLLLATALQEGLITLGGVVQGAQQEVPLNGQSLGCLSSGAALATWAAVLQQRCPAPMMLLGDQLGRAGLEQLFADFGLMQLPQLPLNMGTPSQTRLAEPLLAAIGQDNLLVSPLQVALAWAALGGDGRLPQPQLVTAVQDGAGQWQRQVVESGGETAVSANSAQRIRAILTRYESILEHSVLALSGPEGEMNAWYLGLAPATAPRYALVLVVEGSSDLAAVEAIGRALLAAVGE